MCRVDMDYRGFHDSACKTTTTKLFKRAHAIDHCHVTVNYVVRTTDWPFAEIAGKEGLLRILLQPGAKEFFYEVSRSLTWAKGLVERDHELSQFLFASNF